MLSCTVPLLAQIVVGAEVLRECRVRRVVLVPSVRVAQMAVEVLLAQVAVQLVRVHEALLAELAEGVASVGGFA